MVMANESFSHNNERSMKMLVRPVPVQPIAACFALAAFALSMISGLAAGNDSGEILTRSIVTLFVCWCVGLCLASVASVAVHEFIENYRAQRPVPESDLSVNELRAARESRTTRAPQGEAEHNQDENDLSDAT